MSYKIIEVKGFWNEEYLDTKGEFNTIAAVGQYDGSFDDDHIFYWFDDIDKIIGDHGDFTIENFETIENEVF